MPFLIECSDEESVTTRGTERLKNGINVSHKTYMIIVSQKSGSAFVFLRTSSGKFLQICFNLQHLCRKAKYWVLADPQRLEYRSCGLFWTDWDWDRPSYLRMNWKFLKFPLPVSNFRPNKEQQHKKTQIIKICLSRVLSKRETVDCAVSQKQFW